MEFLKAQWKTFTIQTGIKGFSFLTNSVYRWESCIWVLALLTGTCLTLKDVKDTWELFESGPTVTSLQMASATPIKIPHMHACLVFDSLRLFNDSADFDDILDSVVPPINVSSIQMSSLKDRKMVLVVAHLLFISTVPELQDITQNKILKEALSEYTLKGAELFNKLVPKTLNNNYKSDVKSLAVLMWKLFELEILREIRYLEYENLDFISNNNITWFGSAMDSPKIQNCLKVDPSHLQFYNRSTTINVRFNYAAAFKDTSPFNVVLYLGPSRMVTAETENLINVKPDISTDYDIKLSILGHYNSIPSRKTHCTNYGTDTSYMDCYLKCAQNYIESNCQCSPLIAAFTQSTNAALPLCRYLKSYNSTHVSKSISLCESACSQPCERFIYTFVEGKSASTTGNNTTAIKVRFVSFIYPEFQESLAMDSKTFLSRLGGNLSFWIGSSFLAILHCVVFTVRTPIDYLYGKKRNNAKEEEPTVHISTTQFWELLKSPAAVAFVSSIVETKLKGGVQAPP